MYNSGTYWLKAVYPTGCSYADTVSFDYCRPEMILIPNLFTPNGDLINDTFFPEWNNVYEYTIDIFNRWGTKVFTTNNSENIRWDGKKNSSDLPDGIYYYFIRYKGFNTPWEEEKGWVQLVR